jgi:hypothetical protein
MAPVARVVWPASVALGGRVNSLFDSIVHGLRTRGWSRIEAEGEALDVIERMRQTAKADRSRNGQDKGTLGLVHESGGAEGICPDSPSSQQEMFMRPDSGRDPATREPSLKKSRSFRRVSGVKEGRRL